MTHRPPGRTPIPPEVAAAFGLTDLQVLAELESYGNRNWLVTESSRKERLVLRRQDLNADVRRIELQLAFQRHLATHGYPVPGIRTTLAGSPLV